ncbi:MAG: SEC-C metal-binding domain-containing protein [Candidatus Hydrothermarchaeales archaeon]
MAKIGRNAPCPCGSGKKYKKCCLPLKSSSSPQQDSGIAYSTADLDDLDILSNTVPDLIKKGRLDEAEKVSRDLLSRYPDQIDGIDRLAEVYEARGNNKKAAEYYRKAAAFAQNNPGFDQEGIDWYLSKAKRLESEE